MNVTLIEFTDHALELLLTTKGTRLTHSEDPATWSEEKKAEHLAYMLDTIKSSWEFVSYTFKIEGVTRAFTHQLVRTRTGSYAQQAMRVVDARDFEVALPASVKVDTRAFTIWEDTMVEVMRSYGDLVDAGVPIQDARGILPTNIETNIMAKFNLRTLSEMAKLRLCTRTQGEYQNVFRSMRDLVLFHHPWAAPFLEVHCVATGACAFPRYGKAECPVYDPRMDHSTLIEDTRKKFWSLRHEAAPVAKDGKAM
jgi:flavin-dependent thymidylate synthase